MKKTRKIDRMVVTACVLMATVVFGIATFSRYCINDYRSGGHSNRTTVVAYTPNPPPVFNNNPGGYIDIGHIAANEYQLRVLSQRQEDGVSRPQSH